MSTIAGIDVVRCADRQQAIEFAAAHPIARYHAIEVRPFYADVADRTELLPADNTGLIELCAGIG